MLNLRKTFIFSIATLTTLGLLVAILVALVPKTAELDQVGSNESQIQPQDTEQDSLFESIEGISLTKTPKPVDGPALTNYAKPDRGSTPGQLGGDPSQSGRTLIGQVQKGPLIFGSQVWVSVLNSELKPTGSTFLTKTTDDLGRFRLESTIPAQLVEITASGYYFDEISGALSASPITLSALVDLAADETPTVNILTTLQQPRFRKLLSDGMSYAVAKKQSQNEVLNVFKIDSNDVIDLNSLFSMNLDGNQDQDSVLLATTAVLSQAASDSITTSSPAQAAHMTILLSRIGADLADDGAVGDSGILARISSASSNVDLAEVRNNVESYFSANGIQVVTPLFEEWIDKDNSGVLPQRRTGVEGLSLEALVNQEAFETVRSNALTFTSLTEGVAVQVSVSAGSQIVKNGQKVSGLFSTVTSADNLAVETTTLGFNQTRRVLLNIGNGTIEWNVGTKPLNLVALSKSQSEGCWSGANNSDAVQWYAIPIAVPQEVTARYVGAGLYWWNGYLNANNVGIEEVSIRSSELGKPGTVLGTSSVVASPNSPNAFFLNSDVSCGSFGPQAYLGSEGVTLNANEIYWLVFKLTGPTTVGLQGIHSPNYLNIDFMSQTASAQKLLSEDGVTWDPWSGAGGGHMQSSYDLPSWYIAE